MRWEVWYLMQIRIRSSSRICKKGGSWKRMIFMKRRYPAAVALLAVMILFIEPLVVWAAEANAHFGSAAYAKYTGETFPVGVYLESETAFVEYSIILSYDPAYVEYVSGAQSGGGGTVLLNGVFEGGSGYVKTMLQFRALAAGDTSLEIIEAAAVDAEGNAFDIVNQGPVPLSIRDEAAVYLEGLLVDGQPLEGFTAGTLDYELRVPYETAALEVEALGYAAEISGTDLTVGENTIDIRLTSRSGIQTVYTLHVIREEAVTEAEEPTGQGAEGQQSGEDHDGGTQIEGDPAVGNHDGGMQAEGGSATGNHDGGTQAEGELAAGNPNGEAQGEGAVQNNGTIQFKGDELNGELPAPGAGNDNAGTGSLLRGMLKQKIIMIPAVVIVLAVVGISVVLTMREEAREAASEQTRKEEWEAGFGWKDPIIVIEDVCMDFKIATQNVSGIKEWMIKRLGGKISYRTLHALSHISFFVYPGEVIGIIGTNGSGKSTLLKIVSGALTPTSGYVKVDRSKIQLLTLGTGFDMELTARENVYLNGSVIGYSREFIDAHYDDIVKFAELEGFMEERVKNFSSGMVSRLGFAIATAGDAAEILILDEVLSVGDEFFRKKSLARIKEMIHGGSTVLMVSHGLGTIMENCTRAVWIEKGKLMMIGDVKRVCEAYRKMGK